MIPLSVSTQQCKLLIVSCQSLGNLDVEQYIKLKRSLLYGKPIAR